MEIKDFLEKLTAADADLLLLQDSEDGIFKHITKANLVKGLRAGGGGGGGVSAWQVKSSDYAAQAGDRIIADTSAASWTLTLPPVDQPIDIELIAIGSASNPLNIAGLTRFEAREVLGLRLSTLFRRVQLTYINSTIGWIASPAGVVSVVYPFTSSNLRGLLLLVKSSEGITKDSNNKILQINDLSENNNHWTQPTSYKQALYLANVYNGKPAINFDNGAKYYDFPSLNNIRTIYWLIHFQKTVETDSQQILGDSNNYAFSAVNTNSYVDNIYSSASVRNGKFRINGNTANIISTPRSANLASLSLVTTDNVTASSFAADRNNTYGARAWQGNLVELAICSAPHSDDEVAQMESYLRSEYNHY